MTHSTEYGIPFSFWSWEDLARETVGLAAQVKASGKQYDRIICLANGGLTMVRLLADQLGTTKISSIQLSFYQGINEMKKEPQIIQPLVADVSGQNILLFEDIVDTGATVEFAIEYLQDHGIASVETAALALKPHSRVKPEFSAVTEDSWVIYPYESRETIVELTQKWLKTQNSIDDIHAALTRIGFDPAQIQEYSLIQ